jgi:hypothetical protein
MSTTEKLLLAATIFNAAVLLGFIFLAVNFGMALTGMVAAGLGGQ